MKNNKNTKSNKFSKPQRTGGALKLKSSDSSQKIDIATIISHSNIKTSQKLPELLAPAGSFESLRAAIAGGADAVYFGGGDFNARINAKNFTFEDIKGCAEIAHKYGVKLYQTLNIQIKFLHF